MDILFAFDPGAFGRETFGPEIFGAILRKSTVAKAMSETLEFAIIAQDDRLEAVELQQLRGVGVNCCNCLCR